MKRRAGWLLLALWLAVGVGLKIQRYADPGRSLEDRTDGAIAVALDNAGWRQAETRPLMANGAARYRIWEHPGCNARIAVAVLGGGAEVTSLASTQMGPDLAFLKHGELSRTAQADRPGLRTLAELWRPELPLIAVAPFPPEQADRCGPLPARLWRDLRL